jgi:GTP-dependent phosphoenolpyruvate carboxykinase
MGAKTGHGKLTSWVDEWAEILQPDSIHWCDGSEEEYDRLCGELVEGGTFRRLNDELRPNSYLALSDPADVARVEVEHDPLALTEHAEQRAVDGVGGEVVLGEVGVADDHALARGRVVGLDDALHGRGGAAP